MLGAIAATVVISGWLSDGSRLSILIRFASGGAAAFGLLGIANDARFVDIFVRQAEVGGR